MRRKHAGISERHGPGKDHTHCQHHTYHDLFHGFSSFLCQYAGTKGEFQSRQTLPPRFAFSYSHLLSSIRINAMETIPGSLLFPNPSIFSNPQGMPENP
jgi:hypothetical protein